MTSSKKTVLVFETGLGRGGAKHSLLTWLEMLRGSGEFEVRILLGLEGWMADQLRERGFAFTMVPMPAALAAVKHGSWKNHAATARRIIGMLGGVLSAWVRTAFLHADVVLLTGGRDFIMIAPLVWRLRARTATIPQSTDWGDIPICRTMCQVAAHTFAISRAVGASITAMGIPSHKVEVLPLIYTEDRTPGSPHRAEVRKELDLPADVPVIGLTGVIREQKGQREAIHILAEVVKELPKILLVIVGAPQSDQADAVAYDREIRALVTQRGLEGNVRFTGWRDDVPRLLRAFDVLLVPSLHTEGVPRVILEGFEAGLFVVGTDMEQFHEIFEGVGALCPARDATAWARTLVPVLGNPARLAAERQRSRTVWQERFSESSSVPILLRRLRALAEAR